MIKESASEPRSLKIENLDSDLVVVGGGLSGLCAAIAAARNGLKVVLIQDRPVLGGNASSEVRLWVLGATSHGGNNNRWAREGGIINELLLENQFRNPGGNPVIFDSILQDWADREENLTLLVNTVVFHCESSDNQIRKVHGFNSQNSTMYHVTGSLFADSSGDGILVHLSGAAYRMGAEQAEEFDEPMAPGEDYGKLLGHSLYFYSKDVGHRVDYVAPELALKDVPALIPRYRSFKTSEHGCSLWWIEWGGRLDTIHQSEEIKIELQKIVYGVWNYIKNSGEFPEARNLALEWVGTIPGKRESRRGEGAYMLTQKDIVQQIPHSDSVSHGGWSIDLHPADGIYGQEQGCNQYHAKGIYGIPFRCMYSQNIRNLFLNGRLLSASHVAFGSTRVMATSSAVGQAIGTAAAVCKKHNALPHELPDSVLMHTLKNRLSADGHYVPNFDALSHDNLVSEAKITVSSEYRLTGFEHSGGWKPLDESYGQLLPVTNSGDHLITVPCIASEPTELTIEIRVAEKPSNHTPERVVAEHKHTLTSGEQLISIPLQGEFANQYQFICFKKNTLVSIGLSQDFAAGILTVKQGGLEKVSTKAKQDAPEGLGVDSFEFWVPERRPKGQNIAFQSATSLHSFSKQSLTKGALRPTALPNVWMAKPSDPYPNITLEWDKPVTAKTLTLYLDCDYDHPLESVQYRHHDRVMPLLAHQIRCFVNGQLYRQIHDNRMGVIRIELNPEEPLEKLGLSLRNSQGAPVAVFGIRVDE
ncbi:putative FAD/NAD(P)-binding domain protein [Vibrio nigripulchritudo SFn27]|uniref:Putative FAD/NAD(P)-binding domain protein n=1 Tax=Vibrio nigripulchritudo TaxID=28173 RepID=U4K420_9VIBR|nr:FAD-dependent oxidoreductase [Vibrio nigripulchritudo]CCN80611.1 putative FAD/NAD(P)-binding domain protein [Vibrio nigripulchritudo BLFn1]CCN90575.1 putative FAD/NAD(P)-binding domain protein [Vibrio nigripulchritudo SFn27]CCN93488.1 putative FAD/NAD(P)-binding domain protein [Vibrio nigripulchritudo ENn2]CCO41849.1 putative FAD/NAD(P)-binding domain protein [Vibrio nigripulchritudo SFn135]CCO52039.1 putative FAD/NAD(P)-binding domain protein [Vibrio nigripulchritudo Wn13]